MGPNFLFRTDKKSSGPYINCQANHIWTRLRKCLLVLCAICIRWLVNRLWVVCGHMHRHIYRRTLAINRERNRTLHKKAHKNVIIYFLIIYDTMQETVEIKKCLFWLRYQTFISIYIKTYHPQSKYIAKQNPTRQNFQISVNRFNRKAISLMHHIWH